MLVVSANLVLILTRTRTLFSLKHLNILFTPFYTIICLGLFTVR